MEFSSDFAELCGIITGDGHLSRYISKKRTNYCIEVAGNKTEEIDYFNHISYLFDKLFNKKPKIKYEREYLRLYIYSKKILEIFEKAGLIIGKKSTKAFIPKNILNNEKLSLDFLRGLADTDFSINFKKGDRKNNSYPRIVAVSASEDLIKDVQEILDRLKIKYYKCTVLKNNSFGSFIHYRLELNGVSNFNKWMNLIGFNNPKHLTKIELWKKLGYCPPYTKYSERLEILNESG